MIVPFVARGFSEAPLSCQGLKQPNGVNSRVQSSFNLNFDKFKIFQPKLLVCVVINLLLYKVLERSCVYILGKVNSHMI